MPPDKNPHDELVTWLVIAALAIGAAVMWWWDNHLPQAVVGVLNPVVILVPSWLMARWKRAWYAWLAFWVLAGLYAVSAVVWLTGGWYPGSGLAVAGGVAVLGVFAVLIKMPRRQPPAVPETRHVVHHHVLHGPGRQATEIPAAAWTATVTGSTPRAFTRIRKAITGPAGDATTEGK
jgi:hypothetical protein